VTESAAQELSETLRRQKRYVREAPGARSRGFSQSGEPRFIITNKKKEHQSMMNELFKPLKLVTHHVRDEAQKDQDTADSDSTISPTCKDSASFNQGRPPHLWLRKTERMSLKKDRLDRRQ